MEHPKVQMACVIGIKHPKWDERPLLLIIKQQESLHEQEILTHLAKIFAKWQLPNQVIFVTEIPLTATGKFNKKALRDTYMGTNDKKSA